METIAFRTLALEVARQELGTMEGGLNNHGEKVEEYQTYDSLPGEGYAWCNSFVDFCFAKAGRPLDELYRSAGVELTYQTAKKLGWLVKTPQPGDLVIYTFSHIGFYDASTEKVGYFYAIEGNTGPTGAVSDSKTGGDGVYRKLRSTALVRAYVRVPGTVVKVGSKWPLEVLKTRKGYWAWLAWSLGEGDWRGYRAGFRPARPSVPKLVPASWWRRRRKHVNARKGK